MLIQFVRLVLVRHLSSFPITQSLFISSIPTLMAGAALTEPPANQDYITFTTVHSAALWGYVPCPTH